jgi:hypothetical protein
VGPSYFKPYNRHSHIPRCWQESDPECSCLRLAGYALEESAQDDGGVFAESAIIGAEGGGDV